MRQIYVDLDGVLADTAAHYLKLCGIPITWTDADFPNIRNAGCFYRDQPVMNGAYDLWAAVKKYCEPIILTGVPRSVPRVATDKRYWVDAHFGTNVPVICCFSKDKHKHGKPDDILIDDRTKFMQNWIDMGGVYIHHTSVFNSITELKKQFPYT